MNKISRKKIQKYIIEGDHLIYGLNFKLRKLLNLNVERNV